MKKILFIAAFMLVMIFAMSTSVYAANTTTLDTDIELTTNVVVTDEQVLDLNGKTLTLNASIIVENGGSLTITGNGKIYIYSLTRPIDVMAGGTLVVENGTIENVTSGGSGIRVYGTATDTGVKTNVTIAKDATVISDNNFGVFISPTGNGAYGVTINVDGTILSNTGAPLYINGIIGKNNNTTGNVPVINVSSTAKITSKDAAVYAAGYAIWNIKGGYIEGAEALSIKAGKFNITGGTFKATGAYVDPVTPEYSASEMSGSAISITANSDYAGKVEMNISNATVESKNGYAILETITSGTTTVVEDIAITSGTFTGGKEAVSAQNVTGFITGGTFSSDVTTYVDTTLEAVKDESTGEYIVGVKSKVNVKEAKNGKVTTSIAEAVEGQTVKITATPDKNYELATIKVTDVSGKEVTVKNNTFTMPASEVTVTVTFKEMAKDGTPATGSMDIVLLVSVVVSIAALSVLISKKYVKNN